MKDQNTDFVLPQNIDPSWKIGIVYSTYYDEVQTLVDGAKETLVGAGLKEGNIALSPVYGSFEIPLLGSVLAKTGSFDALMAFGIVIEGETKHAEHVSREVARGIMDIQLQQGIPFAYEVLHVLNIDQARARLDRGKEAAAAVLHSLAQLQQLQS